jgi:hypothetical protein
MGKIYLTVYVDNKYACAKFIFMGCNKAIASKFDFQTHTQVCVAANKAQKERILIPHPCRLSSPLLSSSKTFI